MYNNPQREAELRALARELLPGLSQIASVVNMDGRGLMARIPDVGELRVAFVYHTRSESRDERAAEWEQGIVWMPLRDRPKFIDGATELAAELTKAAADLTQQAAVQRAQLETTLARQQAALDQAVRILARPGVR